MASQPPYPRPPRLSSPLDADGYRIVTIKPSTHGGRVPMSEKRVRVKWVCPKDGQPRGEPWDGVAFDGSTRLYVSEWTNACGHTDQYSDVMLEAMAEPERQKGLN